MKRMLVLALVACWLLCAPASAETGPDGVAMTHVEDCEGTSSWTMRNNSNTRPVLWFSVWYAPGHTHHNAAADDPYNFVASDTDPNTNPDFPAYDPHNPSTYSGFMGAIRVEIPEFRTRENMYLNGFPSEILFWSDTEVRDATGKVIEEHAQVIQRVPISFAGCNPEVTHPTINPCCLNDPHEDEVGLIPPLVIERTSGATTVVQGNCGGCVMESRHIYDPSYAGPVNEGMLIPLRGRF